VNPASILGPHLPVLAVLLPAFTAVLLLLLGDHGGDAHASNYGRRRLLWARSIALASTALGLMVAIQLAVQASGGDLTVYRMGDWPAPFGIVLVIDRLSALMLVLTSVVALQAIIHIAANTGLLPFTGVPLPFISHGGTALAVSLTIMGVVTNVSRHAPLR